MTNPLNAICAESDTIILYLTDKLTDDERYEFESHMMGCLLCREEAERMARE